MTISLQQATKLAELMKKEQAHAATTEEVVIHGVTATVVILDHEDQRDGSWRSVYVLGQYDGSAKLGNVPEGTS